MARRISTVSVTLTVAAFLVAAAGVTSTQAIDLSGGPPKSQAAQRVLEARLQRLREVSAVLKRNARSLMDRRGVVASGVALDAGGEPVIKVLTLRGTFAVPQALEGVRVQTQVSEPFYALQGETCENDPDGCQPTERWPRPVPIGVSVGHSDITAGTLGARVVDSAGNPFILSNNHVLANSNDASFNDDILQPGPLDGGIAGDAIARLHDFEPIHFCTVLLIWAICDETNTMDAAIAALTSVDNVGVSTPKYEPYVSESESGYGIPSSDLHAAYGDPDVIGDSAEDLNLLLGQAVQKYGRTTGWTHGTIDAIDATVDVCYDQACTLIARFEDQLIITPASFINPGDSGSLVVTDDVLKQPVGLAFAGSATNAIANRIDRVLKRFDVSIDEGEGAPQVVDAAVTGIDISPSTVVMNEPATVSVEVSNLGNVSVSFEVDLYDETNGPLPVGTITPAPPVWVNDLGPGQSQTVEFEWTPDAAGAYALTAAIPQDDDVLENNTMDSPLEVNVFAEAPGLQLELWSGTAYTDVWTTVNLAQDYGNDMVVVCTPAYDLSLDGSVIVRVVNATGSSFDLGLGRPWAGQSSAEHRSANVHCMIARQGVYTQADHGIKMEAAKFESAFTDNSSSWVGEPRTYQQSYTSPVVLGQVISYFTSIPGELGAWSAFWSYGATRYDPPSPSELRVGRHTGEDPGTRPTETLAYIVVDSGAGAVNTAGGNVHYKAGLGAASIQGMDDAPPYSYTHDLPNASWAVLGQAGMEGGNGGWPVLYGSDPFVQDPDDTNRVLMAIEEDQYWDLERVHVAEQVGYLLVSTEGAGVPPVVDAAVTGIEVDPLPIYLDELNGGPATVRVEVGNIGNDPLNPMMSFEVDLYDEATGPLPAGTITPAPPVWVNNLGHGQSQTLEFDWTPDGAGTYDLRAEISSISPYDEVPQNNSVTLEDVAVLDTAPSGPHLELWSGTAHTDAWTTVNLDQDYENEMVVVCTPAYDLSLDGPVVVRVVNASGSSFDVGLGRPWFGQISGEHRSANVHCMIARQGVYTQAEHGIVMEAVKFVSGFTDNSTSWVGESRTYQQSYASPVVLGQVISYSTSAPGELGVWTAFWTYGASRYDPPSPSALGVGRHTGEDPGTRPSETLAYIVVDSGTGTVNTPGGNVHYEAGLGADSIQGMGDAPPYSYTHNLPNASRAILSQAGMGGGNGGWAILYGPDPFAQANEVSLAIEEDWYWDSERVHTTERVGYILFE